MFGEIIEVHSSDTEGKRYGMVDMGGWEIYAQRFSAPLREGFHYFGKYADETFVGPCNGAEDVWREILDIRAEVRPEYFAEELSFSATDELERASIIALARRLDESTLDSEACAAGPGRYEGADDLALVVALDILSGHGCADDQAGSTEYGLSLSRFGRHVLAYDDRGFVSAWREDSAEDAQKVLDDESERQAPMDEEI